MKLYYAVKYGGAWHWIHFRTKDDGPQYAWPYFMARKLLLEHHLSVKEHP